MCHNGDSCHERAPRGAKTGTQGLKGHIERSRIPQGLCEHIVDICEQYTATQSLDTVRIETFDIPECELPYSSICA